MDNLYADLENYNEVNIVEELRNENKELKLKLEEYETAIGKLQKSLLQDYDKLVLEFNSLQTNYSSLLKTARAEVERKAQMITQLNLDKDMMILKTLQNGNNRVRNRFQGNNRNSAKASNVGSKINVNKKTRKEQEHNISDDKSDRIKTNRSSNASVPASDNSKLINILDKVMENVDTCISKGELKENVSHCKPPHTDSLKMCSINSRRKSMPAFNSQSQFSTDEDCESDKPTKPTLINKLPPQEISTNCSTKICNEKLSSKTSETSISGRSSNNQELPKEDCKTETSRSSDPEKLRQNDGFKGPHRLSDKSGDHEKLRESDKHKEGDKLKVSYKDRKDINIRQGEQTREGETCREGDKYKDGNKFREDYKFRDSGKFREDVKFRESEKFRENVEHGEGDRSRQIAKYRLSDRNREPDKFREGDKYWDSDKYRESEKYRQYDKFREGDKYRESEKYREYDKYRDSDKYRMGDKNRDYDKFKDEDKYRDTDKFRSREKFDQRYRRRYSPERSYKRNYREFQDDHRPEHRKYRVLSSPSPETQNVYQQRSQQHDVNYEFHRHKSDVQKPRKELKHSENQSLDNHDEPSRKRQKIDYEVPIDDRRHDRNPVVRTASNEYDMLQASCQSPDAVFSPETQPDSILEHTIKEIKNVAATPLEDPRITSRKYIIQTENGIEKLSTAVSKHVHIKPIDKSLWNIESVAIPDALLHEPQAQFSEETIKQMYMDIDNFESNVSVESGELVEDTLTESVDENDSQVHEVNKIHVSKTTTQITKPEQVQKISEIYNIPKALPSSKNNPNEVFNVTEDLGKNITANNVFKVDQTASTPPTQLSHIDKDINLVSNTAKNVLKEKQDSTMPQSKLPQTDEDKNLVPTTAKNDKQSSNVSQSRQSQIDDDENVLLPTTTKNDLLPNKSSPTSQSILPQINEHENLIPDNFSNVNLHPTKNQEHTGISLSEMAMVQDDLELSDETSDNMEFHKQLTTEQDVFRRTQSTVKAKVSDTKCDLKIAPEIQADNLDNINIMTDVKLKESNGHKKHKNKKRKTKGKEKDVDEWNDDVIVTEKKIKSKKSKEQNKNRFTDLFGDSSSLITPEDLGIPSTCVPLCEDAQDAVDINIKEITRSPQNENIQQDRTKNQIFNKFTQDCNVDETRDKDQTSNKNEVQVACPNVDTNIYQNLNAEIETNKPDIVKTVIISSGIQPQFILDNAEGTTEILAENMEVNKQNIVEHSQLPVGMESKKQVSLQALATSTPHKEFSVLKKIETDSSNSVSVSNDSKIESVDAKESIPDKSNTQESHDAPDVRIFVRRRRKGVKKT